MTSLNLRPNGLKLSRFDVTTPFEDSGRATPLRLVTPIRTVAIRLFTQAARGLWLLLFFGCLLSSPCRGQNLDPFGSPTTPTPTTTDPGAFTPSPASSSTTPLTDAHPVVSSLRNNPPRTPVEIGKAILYMKRIERWKEAARYLEELAGASVRKLHRVPA